MMFNFTMEDEWIIKQIYKRWYRNWKGQKIKEEIEKLRDTDNT